MRPWASRAPGEEEIDGRGVAHVGRGDEGRLADAQGGGLDQGVLAAAGEDEPVSLTGELDGDRTSDAGARAGHDGDLRAGLLGCTHRYIIAGPSMGMQ